jgi:hypothetical protein
LQSKSARFLASTTQANIEGGESRSRRLGPAFDGLTEIGNAVALGKAACREAQELVGRRPKSSNRLRRRAVSPSTTSEARFKVARRIPGQLRVLKSVRPFGACPLWVISGH